MRPLRSQRTPESCTEHQAAGSALLLGSPLQLAAEAQS